MGVPSNVAYQFYYLKVLLGYTHKCKESLSRTRNKYDKLSTETISICYSIRLQLTLNTHHNNTERLELGWSLMMLQTVTKGWTTFLYIFCMCVKIDFVCFLLDRNSICWGWWGGGILHFVCHKQLFAEIRNV